MSQETKFFQALKDVFIGATIEGASGYINLMRIKARYFEAGVFPQLMREIDAAVAPFPGFREELFDKLYDFFHRYFSESGSIYFRYTPLHQRVYERVYSDERDVALFYKTHMLYYVKTDRLFQSMDAVVDGLPFHFDVSGLEHKRANEKRALVFEFRERRGDNVLVLGVGYSENGRKTKIEEMVRAVQRTGVRVDEETLERAFRLFERQSEVDFFINKDARGFLRQQFDLWLYQYVFEPEQRSQTLWSERRIRQVQVLKDTAYRIIDFIAQFEDELVRIWNKPKFVRGSHYIITLERVAAQGEAGQALLRRFLEHPGMGAQAREWRELGMVGDDFAAAQVWAGDATGQRLDERSQFLPLDTRHFPDLEGELTALFDHLDDALDGWLVRSDNYQALISLLPKYRGRVGCIYIDPPYNTAASEIIYANSYKHASWLTLMENRLSISRALLNNNGVEVVAIDDTEMTTLSELLETLLPGHDRSVVVVNHHPAGAGLEGTNISATHEYALFMTPAGKKVLHGQIKGEMTGKIGFIRTGTADSNLRMGRPNSFYAVLVDPKSSGVVGAEPPPQGNDWPRGSTPEGYLRIYPVSADGTERVWRRSYESCLREIEKGNIECQNNKTLYLVTDESQKHKPIYSNWTHTRYNAGAHGTNLLTNILGTPIFSYPKSIYTVMDCVSAATVKFPDALVLDYFAGSGTTAHAVMNLNRADGGQRKYILVEMGEHFETVILPRVKKVAFSDRWRDGVAQPGGQGISHFVKVFSLEQYEDVLRRAVYADAEPLFVQGDPYNQYVFLRDLKLLDNAETGEAVMTLDYQQDAVHVHLERLYPDVDVAETLSCVTGQRIRRLTGDAVELENGERFSLADPPWEAVKPLIWW